MLMRREGGWMMGKALVVHESEGGNALIFAPSVRLRLFAFLTQVVVTNCTNKS